MIPKGLRGIPSPQSVAASISQMEGYNVAGSLAQRNNNPGNLRFVGQAGAVQGQGGFAAFPTPEAGQQALLDQINLDASRGMTLTQFVNSYAPPSENDTSNYLNFVSSQTGIDPNSSLTSAFQRGLIHKA